MEANIRVWTRKLGGLVGLRPVLEAWAERSYAYCECHGFDDNSWWYNERASISVLAGAAWGLRGWCALEEFPTDKRRKGEIPDSKADAGEIIPERHRGRCDLWIGGAHGYALEAKQAWQSIGPHAKGDNPRVRKQLDAAWDATGCLAADEADTRVAAVFVSPYLPVSAVRSERIDGAVDRQKVHAAVEAWLPTLKLTRRKHVDAFAWIFPEKCEGFVSSSKKYVFPGSVLILSRRQRGFRRSSGVKTAQ